MTTTIDTTDTITDAAAITHIIPDYSLTEFTRRVTNANARAARAGITATIGMTHQPHPDTIETDHHTGVRYVRHWIEVTLTTPVLQLGSWTLIAELDIIETGALMRTHGNGFELLRNWPRPDPQLCQHCNTRRNRNRNYVLRNNDTGEIAQIGSTCVEAFTGITVNPTAMRMLHADDMFDEFDDQDPHAGGQPDYPMRDILALAWTASDSGRAYVSRALADSTGRHTTGEQVRQLLIDDSPVSRVLISTAHRIPAATIDAILADIETTVTDDSEYGYNLRLIAAAEFVTTRNIALLVSAVAVHLRAESQRAASGPALHEWIAEKGDKITDVDAVVTGVRKRPSNFRSDAITTYLTLRSVDGHIIVWKASKELDLAIGQSCRITAATVKETAIERGEHRTIITRAKIAPN
ncbi:hypothetical protein ACFWPX_30040 [Nocardia sp. NPDC058518]|uniref:hypothetical protein n=1 Tax=Nocardia sp. NPDC058518 TaxID=3346534 RepID=UPI003655060D